MGRSGLRPRVQIGKSKPPGEVKESRSPRGDSPGTAPTEPTVHRLTELNARPPKSEFSVRAGKVCHFNPLQPTARNHKRHPFLFLKKMFTTLPPGRFFTLLVYMPAFVWFSFSPNHQLPNQNACCYPLLPYTWLLSHTFAIQPFFQKRKAGPFLFFTPKQGNLLKS